MSVYSTAWEDTTVSLSNFLLSRSSVLTFPPTAADISSVISFSCLSSSASSLLHFLLSAFLPSSYTPMLFSGFSLSWPRCREEAQSSSFFLMWYEGFPIGVQHVNSSICLPTLIYVPFLKCLEQTFIVNLFAN